MNYLTSISKAFLATLLYIIAINLIGAWILLPYLDESIIILEHYYLIQGFLQFLFILIFIYFSNGRKWSGVIIRTQSKWYLIAFFLAVAFVIFQDPLNRLYVMDFSGNFISDYNFDGISNLTNLNVLSMVLFIPIGEELFFRGYLQRNLHEKVNPITAIIVSSILFASIHSPYLGLIFPDMGLTWHQFYITIFGGIIAGIIYFKSKSVGPTIVYHVFWNFIIVII